ncbi:hypothetical protein ACPV5L_03880 [Vibrio astriarenae]|uniref:Uncharacterized protein n=1 Tax=Vibrio agarivorans TaxID=153622 RepID=A0ABT7Y397_9VIBR|nr:hypothetical protein [Vibrio agarivorans]MDN2482517.1 hypothetical protein [Vibrio agarivorans]MDN3660838.1 hypothetical protein [Vibrio agarivorans]
MKIILTMLLLAVSTLSFASSMAGRGSTGIPTVPCYVSGEFIGTMPITECERKEGSVYKNK